MIPSIGYDGSRRCQLNQKRTGFPVTVHVSLYRGEEVLLLKRHNTGYRDGWYSLVAGHLEPGERLAVAASREIEEEVGVRIPEPALKATGVMHRRSGDQRVDFFLEAREWQGEPFNREPEKCSQVAWFRVDQLPGKTVPYIRHVLTMERDEFWFDEYGW